MSVAIIFITFFATLMALLHLYIWRRMVRAPKWPFPIRRTTTFLICLLGISIPFVQFSGRFLPHVARVTLSMGAYLWLGILFYLVVIQTSWDVIQLPFWLVTKWKKWLAPKLNPKRRPNPPALHRDSRRAFIARATTGTALLATAGIATLGVKSVFGEIDITETQIKLSRWPKKLCGYRIAMLTDMHIGPILGKSFVDYVVEKTNSLHPDMVVITGDLVDGHVDWIGADIAPLTGLKTRHGVYFVTGNHEYYSGVNGWISYLEKLGIKILMNELVSVGDRSKRGASFDLLGVPDFSAGRYSQIAPNMIHPTRGRDGDRELIALAHQPVQIHQAVEVEAGLQLSGHTHGGQIFPFDHLVRIAQPYVAGLHQHSPSTQIYVSTGTGFWGPPMRVAAPAEIAQVVII